MADRLVGYLTQFDQIVRLYRQWTQQRPEHSALDAVLARSLKGRFAGLRDELMTAMPSTVFDAYNRLTHYATHSMLSARTAFDLLDRLNAAFQETFPIIDIEPIDASADQLALPQLSSSI